MAVQKTHKLRDWRALVGFTSQQHGITFRKNDE